MPPKRLAKSALVLAMALLVISQHVLHWSILRSAGHAGLEGLVLRAYSQDKYDGFGYPRSANGTVVWRRREAARMSAPNKAPYVRLARQCRSHGMALSREPGRVAAPAVPNIRAFWINVAGSTERENYMRRMLANLTGVAASTRVEATDRASLRNMLATGQLLSQVKMITKCTAKCHTHHVVHNEYTEVEVAVTVSHLRTIKTAHDLGLEVGLILEDDIVIQDEFKDELDELLQVAPVDWEIIQLTPKHAASLIHLQLIHGLFINWIPIFFGTGSYLINRRGMERIVRAHFYENGTMHLDNPKVLVADELIYVSARTYTYTRVIVTFRTDFPSEVQVKPTGPGFNTHLDGTIEFSRQHCLSELVPAGRNVTILVASVVQDHASENRNSVQIDLLATNLVVTRPWGMLWHVFVVVSSDAALQARTAWWTAALGHHEHLQLNFRVHADAESTRVSKWVYYAEIPRLAHIRTFRNVIFVDSDMAFAGVPLGDFLLRHQELEQVYQHKVVGMPRQSYRESLLGTRTRPNSWYTPNDGHYWQRCNFEDVLVAPVDFVEQYFVMLDTEFMIWFLAQVLDQQLLAIHQAGRSDYSIDHLWCGAAREYHVQSTAPEVCEDDPQWHDHWGYACGDYTGFSCDRVCDEVVGTCQTDAQLELLQTKCCKTCHTSPRCVLVPFTMLHNEALGTGANETSLVSSSNLFPGPQFGSSESDRILQAAHEARFKRWILPRYRTHFKGGNRPSGNCKQIREADNKNWNEEQLMPLFTNDVWRLANRSRQMISPVNGPKNALLEWDSSISEIDTAFHSLGRTRNLEQLAALLPYNLQSHPIQMYTSTCREGSLHPNEIPLQPRGASNVSLYCFAIALAKNAKLLNESLRRGGLSGCDEFDVFTPDVSLVRDLPDVPITVVAAAGADDVHSTSLGLNVYSAVHTKGRFRKHNLVVQLDVTTIFSPSRLRRIFEHEVLSRPKLWCTNRWRRGNVLVPKSQANLHRAFVVLTPSAFELFGQQRTSACEKDPVEHPEQATNFLFHCLTRLNVTRSHAALPLVHVGSQGIDDVGEHCAYAAIPAFAERHSPAGFSECWAQMRLADLADESRCAELSGSGEARRCCAALDGARQRPPT